MGDYTIYIFTNKINGKVYVGLTSTSLKKRWSRHVRKARYLCKKSNGNYFQRAIVKYGKDAWDSNILEKCSSLEEAEKAEQKWIAHYKSNQKEFGYNLTIGGKAGPIVDDRVRAKISQSVSKLWQNNEYRNNFQNKIKKWHQENVSPFKGKTHSKETRQKMSKAVRAWHKYNNNPFKGKNHTAEACKKMSDAAKKRCADPNWKPPLVRNGVSDETRKKMSESAKRRERFSSIGTKEELLEVAKSCQTQKEIADKLGCTPANINYLLKRWGIRSYVKSILKNNI